MNKNLTKKEISESNNNRLGYSKEECKDFIEVFFDSIINFSTSFSGKNGVSHGNVAIHE